MTVSELRQLLEGVEGTLKVRYRYDTGYSYPEFRRAYVMPPNKNHQIDEPFLCLDEDSVEDADQ